MSSASIVLFVLIAAMAAFVQTMTGFAFGLIMMGAIALFGLLTLTDAATLIGILVLVNAAQMLLQGGWRHVALRTLALTLCGALPAIFVGYALLEWLADTRMDLLKMALGLVIMASSLQVAMRPEPLPRLSPPASFVGFGAISGLMSGLFAIGGPPLVYSFYRQPLPLRAIRETLVAAFASAQLIRLALVAVTGNVPPPSTLAGIVAVPAVMAGTYAARRWPIPISPNAMRRVVFLLLFLSGVSVALQPALHLALG